MIRWLLLLKTVHCAVELTDVVQLLACDPQHPSRHGYNGEHGRQHQSAHFQINEGLGKNLFVGANLILFGGVTRCGRSQERLIWVGALVGIGFHPIIPSKGRKWCIEQRWEPNRQQSQWEAAGEPRTGCGGAGWQCRGSVRNAPSPDWRGTTGTESWGRCTLPSSAWNPASGRESCGGMKGRVMPVHKSATSRLKKK